VLARSIFFGVALPSLLASLGGCDADTAGSRAPEPPTAIDLDPSAGVVEVRLVAEPAQVSLLPGTSADVWAYRDAGAASTRASLPGPIIRAKKGDRVVVHLKNDLPETTTIHWHGVRVPPGSDGTLAAQAAIEPGDEFTYEFAAEDAGTFWYHPHVRGDVQIERGLYGMLVVSGEPDVPVDADRAFVLDDVKLEADGKLSEQTDPLDVMLGRQGNVLLVNGQRLPTLEVKAAGRERWRFVNAANGRYFNLRLPDRTFRVIGWDGGLLEEPYDADTLLIAPGERYEVLVEMPGEAGGELSLETIHYDRGHEIPDPGPKAIMKIAVSARAAGDALGELPALWGAHEDLAVPSNAPERSIVLSEDENTGAEPVFFINGASFPAVAPVEAVSGDVETWSVENDSEMDHPFHLHGMFFRVLDIGGVAPAHEGWKDTVNVPRKQTLRFAVRYGAAGTWMFHCHILEHAERGMMGELVLAQKP
jgi:FtsP/CotA-like multicopper oxidase with cupredoxin domain